MLFSIFFLKGVSLMGTITITRKNSVDAIVELKNVSEETYLQIIAYLQLMGKEPPAPDERLKEIENLYSRYIQNPLLYDLERMTTREFMKRFEACRDCCPNSVGVTLSKMAKKYSLPYELRTIKCYTSENASHAKYFLVPVPAGRTVTYGYLIKRAREEMKMSQKELADCILYPALVVRAWEEDRLIPSCEAIGVMQSLMGNYIFDQLERRGL